MNMSIHFSFSCYNTNLWECGTGSFEFIYIYIYMLMIYSTSNMVVQNVVYRNECTVTF